MQPLWRALRQSLRSPRVIMAEVVVITAAGVVVALVPQADVVGAERLARFQTEYPALGAVLDALGLHALSGSAFFAGLFLLAAASLAIAVGEQWRRARREGSRPLNPESFRSAAYRREGERQRPEGAAPAPAATYTSSGRLGLWGSPVFHAGLIVLILAGVLRLLFGQTAAVDLLEGETLPPVPGAYGAQWGGPLAAPFALAFPLRLDALVAERWPDGALKSFAARITLETPAGPRRERLAVNSPLKLGAERLFLSALHGPAALIEARQPGGTERVAVLLRPVDGRENAFQGVMRLRSGLELRLRGALRADAGPPSALEARILDGGALLFAGSVQTGAEVSLGAHGTIGLPTIHSWAQLRGSRDRALALVYLGFALVIVGATAMFALLRVDTAVLVTPLVDGREHVVVALRAQRLAPLFAERFEALAREHLGPPPADASREVPSQAALAPGAGDHRRRPGFWVGVALLGAGLASGCGRGGSLSAERAERLVRAYNQRLIEAYRSSDPELLEGVAGPSECRKILGLIGVKSDQGISLDATLLSLAVRGVERRAAGTVVVTTEEAWRYADRRIGSGETVGEPSADHYRMAYHLERLKAGTWVVGQVRFASPPLVGRATVSDRVPTAGHAAPPTKTPAPTPAAPCRP